MDLAKDSPDSSALEAQASVNGGSPNLPEEIIEDILARLPVKSLLRFRCVSKSWITLISSQRFIEIHLKRSRRDMNLSNYRIMLTINETTTELKHCSLGSLIHGTSTDACSIDYPRKHRLRGVRVVGSCNGLICLIINEKDFFLWNPSTRKSKRLPPVKVDIKIGFEDIHSFCYNESDEDYKVVGIFSTYPDPDVHELMVMIYSLKAKSWKRIEYFKGGVPVDEPGKFASGKLHRFVYTKSGLDFRRKIVSVDMESEVYGILENYLQAFD